MSFFSNNIELFTIFCILLTTCSIVLASMAWRENANLNRRRDIFMRGRNAENLENYFVDLKRDLDYLSEESDKMKEIIKVLKRHVRSSYQKIGIVNYDAFDMGGNYSFAIALLNLTNTGFIIDCQRNSTANFLYVKEVIAGYATALTKEQRLALESAINNEIKDSDL